MSGEDLLAGAHGRAGGERRADAARQVDAARRFGGVARVYGEGALPRLARAHVCIVGVGGVGSWAVEALARSGIGRLTLIDLDHVAESNVNRQVHALGSTLGASKVEAMRARIADISPDCRVHVIDDFIGAGNVEALLPADALVVDAIDAPRAKAATIACACRRGQPILVCGGAGGRTDPLRLRRDDLALVRGDALLSAVRARLRREHGFPREPGARFGVDAVHSDEPPVRVAGHLACEPQTGGGAPLGCAGYGSLVTVTATMGLAAASWAITRLLAGVPGTTASFPAAAAASGSPAAAAVSGSRPAAASACIE